MVPGKMGNCVSDAVNKNREADDKKIIISQSSRKLKRLTEKTINVKYVSIGDEINNASISNTDYIIGGSRRSMPLLQPPYFQDNQKFVWGSGSSEDESIIVMNNPKFSHCERKRRKSGNTSNSRRNIVAPSQQRAGGRNVRRLKLVISAKELRELLNSNGASHSSSQGDFVSVVLEKLSLKCERSCGNGSMIMRNSRQGKGNYNSNCHTWRPSLEDIPEDFTQD